MRTDVRLPALAGSDASDGEVVRWLVKVGEQVTEGQPILELVFEKATLEVVAPVSGLIVELRVRAGDVVRLDEIVATIE